MYKGCFDEWYVRGAFFTCIFSILLSFTHNDFYNEAEVIRRNIVYWLLLIGLCKARYRGLAKLLHTIVVIEFWVHTCIWLMQNIYIT